MEKPVIKVQLNRQTSPQPHDTSALANDTRETLHAWPTRTQRHEATVQPKRFLPLGLGAGKRKVLLPVLLATITGVLLGVCLLVLFRGQSTQATVTTVQPTPAQTRSATGQAVQSSAQVSGQSLYTWQIGSFAELSKAQKAQQEFAAQHIEATIRQAGNAYQLLVGVAVDKQAGKALEAELTKMKIKFYAKPLQISARQGVISGLQAAEAKALTDGLGQEMKLATAALQNAGMAAPNAKTVAALQQQADSMQADERGWHSRLVQAGLNGEAAQLDTLHKQLTTAITALQTPGHLLAAQANLTAFYVGYEALITQLIKAADTPS